MDSGGTYAHLSGSIESACDRLVDLAAGGSYVPNRNKSASSVWVEGIRAPWSWKPRVADSDTTCCICMNLDKPDRIIFFGGINYGKRNHPSGVAICLFCLSGWPWAAEQWADGSPTLDLVPPTSSVMWYFNGLCEDPELDYVACELAP